MGELKFAIESAEAIPFAVAPTIAFALRISGARSVQSIALRCQIMIEATRRRHSSAEQLKMNELFGEPERWSKTLRPLLWTHVQATVPGFESETVFQLPVPCTFDFNVAAAKYFHGVQAGDVPLVFQFSGTIFYTGENGMLQIAQIAWDREARFALPVDVWKQMMDFYYPNSAWLRVRLDLFDQLAQYKLANNFANFDDAMESLLAAQKEFAS
jgi:hypothetical protein